MVINGDWVRYTWFLAPIIVMVKEDQSEAIRVLEEALKSAAETQDPITYVLGGFYLGFTHGL